MSLQSQCVIGLSISHAHFFFFYFSYFIQSRVFLSVAYLTVANLARLGISVHCQVSVFSQAPLLVLDYRWSHNPPTYQRTVTPNWYRTHSVPKFGLQSSWMTGACHYTRLLHETFSSKMNRDIAKVSGVSWNKDNGKFVFDFSNIIEITRGIDPRKRNILKLIGVFLTLWT